MNALIVGASAGLGRALAQELARHGWALRLVASDIRDLEATAADLRLRHGVEVDVLAVDVARDPDATTRIAAFAGGTPIDAALFPIGLSRRDDDFSGSGNAVAELIAINLQAPIAIVHAILPGLLQARGTVVLFGSVAAVRGRGANVVYAAAKRGLESFQESLRQRYRDSELRVHFYRLGFLATNLTHGMALPMAAADPQVIAVDVVQRIHGRSALRHRPRVVALVAQVLPWLPVPLFRRLRG